MKFLWINKMKIKFSENSLLRKGQLKILIDDSSCADLALYGINGSDQVTTIVILFGGAKCAAIAGNNFKTPFLPKPSFVFDYNFHGLLFYEV